MQAGGGGEGWQTIHLSMFVFKEQQQEHRGFCARPPTNSLCFSHEAKRAGGRVDQLKASTGLIDNKWVEAGGVIRGMAPAHQCLTLSSRKRTLILPLPFPHRHILHHARHKRRRPNVFFVFFLNVEKLLRAWNFIQIGKAMYLMLLCLWQTTNNKNVSNQGAGQASDSKPLFSKGWLWYKNVYVTTITRAGSFTK